MSSCTRSDDRSGHPTAPVARRHVRARRRSGRRASRSFARRAADDVDAIHQLIEQHVAEGRLLPRQPRGDRRPCLALRRRDRRQARRRRAPIWRRSADAWRRCARSSSATTCDRAASDGGWWTSSRARAAAAGFETLSAFTHAPGYFVQMGFSIVPHTWLPEKIEADCRSCAQFRTCGQYAVMLPLVRARQIVRASDFRCMPDVPSTVRDFTITPASGRRHRAGGLPVRGAALRHQGRGRGARPDGARRRRRRLGGRDSSPPTWRRPRRCSSRSAISSAASGVARAIVVNSGCANACTGDQGMARRRAHGRRGRRRPRMRARAGARRLDGRHRRQPARWTRSSPAFSSAVPALARGKGSETARAIMTTDPFPKECAVTVQTGRGSFMVGGTAKGSGMIEPNMATMLGFLTTDAAVPPALLHRALRESARDTFNAITVDGECSTNDSLFALASGASGVTIDEDSYPALLEAFLAVSRELALGIVRGGEGATKLIAVNVHDARSGTMRGRWRARSPTRRWSRPPCTAPIPTGDASSPRPGGPACKFDMRARHGARRRHSAVRERAAARRCRAAGGRAPEEHGRPDRREPRHRRQAPAPRSGPAI